MRDNSWYILRTSSKQENEVANWLQRKGYGEQYVPMAFRKQKLPKNKRNNNSLEPLIEVPVFSGFVFFKFNVIPDWEVLRLFCHGLLGLYMRGVTPCLLNDDDIRTMQLNVAKGIYNHGTQMEHKAELLQAMIGEIVKVPYGTMTGVDAEVFKIKKEQVKLKVSILGRETFLKLPIDDVFPELFDNA